VTDRAAFTAYSDRCNAKWAREAEAAGNHDLAAVHRAYATGKVKPTKDGKSFEVEPDVVVRKRR
jgi:hypothetical protein